VGNKRTSLKKTDFKEEHESCVEYALNTQVEIHVFIHLLRYRDQYFPIGMLNRDIFIPPITITILDIIHSPVFHLKIQRFGDWILLPSSGGTYSDGLMLLGCSKQRD
jgi:hypothetical protein